MRKLMKIMGLTLLLSTLLFAKELNVVLGSVGSDVEVLKKNLALFEKETGIKANVVSMPASTTDQFGQYKLWLSAKNDNIDLYYVDVIWAPQIANHLVDLSPYTKDIVKEHFPSIIESQTVNGRLVALPAFTDAPALYYRADLLKKHKASVPKTWEELTKTAKMIVDKEKNPKLQGFVWQGNAYEGLTCDALEWVKSHGGGQIIEADGSISINNKKAADAIKLAKSWVGTISPKGVLAYQEEESRGVWQTGNAVFMRNWPYAYSLGNSDDSKVKGKFGVVALPASAYGKSAATLGGWNIAVSKYSKYKDDAVKLAKFLTSKKIQKKAAIENSKLPTIISLYTDGDVAKASPIVPNWLDIFKNAVPRPSAPTKRSYNEVSKEFYTAVHNALSGKTSVEASLKNLERKLKRLKGKGWK